MNQWIVEGTRLESFRMAQSIAQQHADLQQAEVPLVKDCPTRGLVVVKMVSPRQKTCRTRVGPGYHEGSFHPVRFAPGATAPAWDRSILNRMN